MKIKINENGYSHLLNDQNKEIFCIKRQPAQTIIPDKLGQPIALEIPTQASLCGDHCPFFRFIEDTEKLGTGVAELCHDHLRGVGQIITQNTPELKILKP